MNRFHSALFMPKGLWVWPSDPKGQRRMLKSVAGAPHLMAAMAALSKSKDGMSDSDLAEAVTSGWEWTVLWVMRQLTSLGFVEYKVDFFGNAARYQLTEAGRVAYAMITGQHLPQKPPAPAPQAPQPAAPKAA